MAKIVSRNEFLFLLKIGRMTFPYNLYNSFMCISKLLLLFLVLFKRLLDSGDFHSQNGGRKCLLAVLGLPFLTL